MPWSPAPTSRSSLPTCTPPTMSGLCLLMVNRLRKRRSVLENPLTFDQLGNFSSRLHRHPESALPCHPRGHNIHSDGNCPHKHVSDRLVRDPRKTHHHGKRKRMEGEGRGEEGERGGKGGRGGMGEEREGCVLTANSSARQTHTRVKLQKVG